MRSAFVALLAVVAITAAPASADARFKNLSKESGLPGVTAFKVIQDRRGYIWIATSNGLERYDGYRFTTFKHRANNPASLASDTVASLFEDASGRLWVGTYGSGLDLYQPQTGTFRHYRHREGDPTSIASDKIICIASDSAGDLLLGTYESGLDVFNPDTGKLRHYSAENGSGLSGDRVFALFTDGNGRSWVGTRGGLDEIDAKSGAVHVYLNPRAAASDNYIRGISEGPDDELLLATAHGPHTFLPQGALFDQGKFVFNLPEKLRTAPLIATKLDAEGDILLGSVSEGLSTYNATTGALTTFTSEPSKPDSLISTYIFDIYQDSSGLIWIATDAGVEIMDPRLLGITYMTPFELTGRTTSQVSHMEGMLALRDALIVDTASDIYSLTLDPVSVKRAALLTHIDPRRYGVSTAIGHFKNDEMLVATSSNYLIEIDAHGRVNNRWHIGDVYGPTPTYVRSIAGTGDGPYYLGAFGRGLVEFQPRTGAMTPIAGTGSNELAVSDQVETLLPIQPATLLAGTFRGLFRVDLHNHSSSLISLSDTTSQPVIQALYADPHGDVWVGTYEGLWRLSFDAAAHLTGKKYFPQVSTGNDIQVLAIVPDTQGNLWLASDDTLRRFNPQTGELLVLGKDQGMPPLEYFSYDHTRTSDGEIWFGGTEGIVGFDPKQLRPNAHAPKVIINGITAYIGNQPFTVAARPDNSLKLSYQYSVVTFDLASTDFAAPQANTYSYRLLGFQPEWTQPSTSHSVTFTNLNPGRYRLEVRAANTWGTWSAQPAALEIVVLPPWWRTWWAYTLYLLVIIGSSIGYVYSLKRKIEREKQVSTSLREANEIKSNFVDKLQTQVAAATKELRETLQGVNLKNAELEIAQKRATEGEQIKSQFLANMSHELRTPLTGVLGYTKLLTSTHLTSEQKDYVGTIRQSSETLLSIINDTLDHSRLEAGKLLIDEVDFDLLEVIESTLELVAPTAYQKRLELIRVVPADVPLQLRGDPLRLRQVLTNLLSNAIKFTEHGSISVSLRAVSTNDRDATLAFTVSDTGIGIPTGELPQLFHAYARSRISTRHHVEGTGLGLSICKKLLDLMGGDIQVRSRVGSGTSFDFQLSFKLQKNAQPRVRLPKKIKILLYDMQPLSNKAWQACLIRLGAEVENAVDLEAAITTKADAAVMALSEQELSQLGALKRRISPALPPTLILAPRIDRQALKDLSETLYHRVLSKAAREKTLYLELQSLLQAAVQETGDSPHKIAPIAPTLDAPLVLIADDNRINRRLLVTMLNHAGFRTSEAVNGLELLDLAARGPWDAALLDIHMPGMDGMEAAGRLRGSFGDNLPPIIAMSADVMPETRQQLEGLMDDFLVKPFSEQDLVDKLRWHLDRHARKKRDGYQSA